MGLALGGALVALGSPRFAFVVVGSGAALTALIFAQVHFGNPLPESAGVAEAAP